MRQPSLECFRKCSKVLFMNGLSLLIHVSCWPSRLWRHRLSGCGPCYVNNNPSEWELYKYLLETVAMKSGLCPVSWSIHICICTGCNSAMKRTEYNAWYHYGGWNQIWTYVDLEGHPSTFLGIDSQIRMYRTSIWKHDLWGNSEMPIPSSCQYRLPSTGTCEVQRLHSPNAIQELITGISCRKMVYGH